MGSCRSRETGWEITILLKSIGNVDREKSLKDLFTPLTHLPNQKQQLCLCGSGKLTEKLSRRTDRTHEFWLKDGAQRKGMLACLRALVCASVLSQQWKWKKMKEEKRNADKEKGELDSVGQVWGIRNDSFPVPQFPQPQKTKLTRMNSMVLSSYATWRIYGVLISDHKIKKILKNNIQRKVFHLFQSSQLISFITD